LQPQETGPSPALERVVTLGASLTAGFGVGIEFASVLESLLTVDGEVESVVDVRFFLDPRGVGEKCMQRVLALDPTLLCAIDFLFWFAYGDTEISGDGEDEVALRLDRLEQGFELLERCTAIVVVGDFPDMNSAEGHMLRRSQIPSPAALRALNERLRVWAGARDRVVVLPLSQRRELLRSTEGFRVGRVEIPAGSELLLADELHPSHEGQAAIALWIADMLVDAGLARMDEFRFDFEAVMDELLARREGVIR
jgi:hypothetical protein